MAPPRKPTRPNNKRPSSFSKAKKKPGQFRPLAGGTKAVTNEKPKDSVKKPKPPRATLQRRSLVKGPAPRALSPVMLDMPAFEDYELLDSGFELKLERYGPYKIIRPEGQALWQPSLSQDQWDQADAVFSGEADEDATGRWRFQNKLKGAATEDVWPLHYNDIGFHARFTAFRHMGFFPEQTAHWQWFEELIKEAGRPIKVLNLFGYTGIASLVAANAGANVTHIDASKKAIGWARENQSISGLDDKPIRWICEDAVKFVEREARRGNTYDAIIMDPPKYGRGPNGEVWQFFEGLNDLLHNSRTILSKDPLFFILSSYALRASFMASHELARDVFSGLGGVIESGELLIKQSGQERRLSTSLYTRWSKGKIHD